MIQHTRRQLVAGSLSAAIASKFDPAFSQNACGPMGCVAGVSIPSFIYAYTDQHQPQWCWAASISMIFGYYNHPVDQQRIVTEVYGAPINMPAMSGFVIASQINRSWVDDFGRPFHASLTAAYDAQAGVTAINNQAIVYALAGGHPIIVGARTHAVVMTQVQYLPTPLGPRILNVQVFDPWPGVGARLLMADEMQPAPLGGSLNFLALAQVS